MDKKHQKMPQKGRFSPICDPPSFFFKNRALSLLYPYGALTSCNKLEKTNERSLRYLETDGPRTMDGRTRTLTKGPPRVNLRSKINKILRAVSDIWRTDKTDHGWTNGRTDMGDYKGPSQVNLRSKIKILKLSNIPSLLSTIENPLKARGGPGLFLHLWFIWQYFILLNSRFLTN